MMSSTEDKIIKITKEVIKHKETSLSEVSKATGCTNPLIRGVLGSLVLGNGEIVEFTGKKIKVSVENEFNRKLYEDLQDSKEQIKKLKAAANSTPKPANEIISKLKKDLRNKEKNYILLKKECDHYNKIVNNDSSRNNLIRASEKLFKEIKFDDFLNIYNYGNKRLSASLKEFYQECKINL